MKPISPNVGLPEITAHADPGLSSVKSIPAAVVLYNDKDNTPGRIVRWKPTGQERALIVSGGDVYISFMGVSVPVHYVGTRPEWAEPKESHSLAENTAHDDMLMSSLKQYRELAGGLHFLLNGECPAYPGVPSACDPEMCDCLSPYQDMSLEDLLKEVKRRFNATTG